MGKILTEHVGNSKLTEQGEKDMPDAEIFQRDFAWIHEADIVVAEVTQPSLGVGYELGLAESAGKPIICLFRETEDRRLSAMIAGNSKLMVHQYEDVDEAVSYIGELPSKSGPVELTCRQ